MARDEIVIKLPEEFDAEVREAIGFFWLKRDKQARDQGKEGKKDYGLRTAATGGKQMDGFAYLLENVLKINGVPSKSIIIHKRLELPGYFRPTKKWDLFVIHNNKLLAVVELKSLNGPSFGNNFNNRTEEAVGSATDIWTAYREGAFGEIRRPWLGYLFMLEDSDDSTKKVRTFEPHFPVFRIFRWASYAKRAEEMCRRLVREGLYSEAAFIMSKRADYEGSSLTQPAQDLEIKPFVQSLVASVVVNL